MAIRTGLAIGTGAIRNPEKSVSPRVARRATQDLIPPADCEFSVLVVRCVVPFAREFAIIASVTVDDLDPKGTCPRHHRPVQWRCKFSESADRVAIREIETLLLAR
jgi:hypothetical protein